MRLFSMYRWVRERHMIGIRGRNFMEAPWAGGIVLLGCVIIAMLLANLPATSLYYRHLLETDLSLMVHSPDGLIDWVFPRGMTVEKLINDGLMVIFFFSVGLEIKREIVCGQDTAAMTRSIQARLEEIQSIIAKRGANETQYDDSIVRQMIECIKVYGDGRLTIIFGGGYEIEETL